MAEKTSKRNFIVQQGFVAPSGAACEPLYDALAVQPRIVSLAVLSGVVFQSATVFAALGAVLWWSALFPRWNPFDALYNAAAYSRSGVRLEPAPAPRRFAQMLSGLFSLAIAALVAGGWLAAAVAFEALFLAAIAAFAFGRFCFGSFLYHWLRGRGDFALRTLPWRS